MDAGDFDCLRLYIIRQLKDDVELRNYILDMVKQSAALNQPGAGTMKPRQLSDAIHEEIGFDGIGIRIEDEVLITESGYEVLTGSIPKETKQIEYLLNNFGEGVEGFMTAASNQ